MWLYINFRKETNRAVRVPLARHFEAKAGEPWITHDKPSPRGDNQGFLEQIMRHRFVLCPPGNGVDTHRMWEALAAGAIPVVQKSPAIEPFASLPVLVVEDLRCVNLSLLRSAADALQSRELGLLRAGRGQHLIEEFREDVADRPLLSWRDFLNESARYALGMARRRLAHGT